MNVFDSGELSHPHARVLAPFATQRGLRKRGVINTSGLIALPVSDSLERFYPHAQFTYLPKDRRLVRREPVIEFWNEEVTHHIGEEMGLLWNAARLLLQKDTGPNIVMPDGGVYPTLTDEMLEYNMGQTTKFIGGILISRKGVGPEEWN